MCWGPAPSYVIVGAGSAGQLTADEMRRNPELGYTPIGYVDDDPRHRGRRVRGIRVLGTTDDLLIGLQLTHSGRFCRPCDKKKLVPRIAERFAAKIGAETAEKWAGRLIPLASSAIGGALNFSFVRGWGRRVQRHLRTKHLEAKASAPPPGNAAVEAALN